MQWEPDFLTIIANLCPKNIYGTQLTILILYKKGPFWYHQVLSWWEGAKCRDLLNTLSGCRFVAEKCTLKNLRCIPALAYNLNYSAHPLFAFCWKHNIPIVLIPLLFLGWLNMPNTMAHNKHDVSTKLQHLSTWNVQVRTSCPYLVTSTWSWRLLPLLPQVTNNIV